MTVDSCRHVLGWCVLAALVASCAGEPTSPFTSVAPPSEWDLARPAAEPVAPPPLLTLDVGHIVRGTPLTLTVSDATPGERVTFLAGVGGLGLHCPALMPDSCLSILPPILRIGRAEVDVGGVAVLEVTVPADARMASVAMQAVEGLGNRLSAPEARDLLDELPHTPYLIAALPDTQHYSDNPAHIAHYIAQTQWIVDNREDYGIAFVTHPGDIVEHGGAGVDGNQAEWDRALEAMDILDGDLLATPDGLIPYGAVIGNHDYDIVGSKSSPDRYLEHFGPERYAGRSWFVGASPDDVSMSQVFEAGGRDVLHLALEWLPTDDAVAWAQDVLAANPTLPVVLTTHEYTSTGNPASRRTTGNTPDGTGDNSPDQLYRKLVEPYPGIFLVLAGHVIGDGRRTSVTALGETVHEVLIDYQGDPEGGNGWMGLIEVQPDAGLLVFETFSPTYVPGLSPGPDRFDSSDSNFSVELDIVSRRTLLETRNHLRFRQGLDSGHGTYLGAQDTHIGHGDLTPADTPTGGADSIRVDGDESEEQGLLQFADVLGCSPGQVPPGATVEAAVLTLTTEGPNADSAGGAGLHRMSVAWSDGDTWDSLEGGVTLGVQAELVAEVDVASGVETKGTWSFDVAADVQAWADGAPAHGWVAVANTSDRWEFRSSDWSAVAERPMLTVRVPRDDRGDCLE